MYNKTKDSIKALMKTYIKQRYEDKITSQQILKELALLVDESVLEAENEWYYKKKMEDIR